MTALAHGVDVDVDDGDSGDNGVEVEIWATDQDSYH